MAQEAAWTIDESARELLQLTRNLEIPSHNPKTDLVFEERIEPQTQDEKKYWHVVNTFQAAIDAGILEPVSDEDEHPLLLDKDTVLAYAALNLSDVVADEFKTLPAPSSSKHGEAQKQRFLKGREASWLRLFAVFANNPQAYIQEDSDEGVNLRKLRERVQQLIDQGTLADSPKLQAYENLAKQLAPHRQALKNH